MRSGELHLKFNQRTNSTPHKFQTRFPSQNLILFQPKFYLEKGMLVKMNIQEYIENLTNGKADNLSVKKMKRIMELLGNPQDKLKFVHVTGTNGKGSIIEMLNSILVNANLKVGKFISPHLVKYNERISTNYQNIQDEEMQELYEKLEKILEKENIEISFFEFFTIIAFMYFYKQKVDIVLMEVGLGGLYDSTNVIYPMISVISSIGYDHMQVLGNTLEEIAKQKARNYQKKF